MPNIRISALTGTLICLLAGPSPAAAQGVVTTTGADLEVIDPGSEPRHVLRYDWTLGQTETARSEYRMEMSILVEGDVLTRMTMIVALDSESTATEVEPDGTTRFETVYTGFDIDVVDMVTDGEPMTAEVAEAMAGAMDAMARQAVGISGWEVYDSLGMLLDTGIDMPAAFPDDLRDTFDQMAAHPAVLPDVAVGEGARWQAAGSVAESGLEMDAMSVIEVLQIDGDSVLLDMALEVSGSGMVPADEPGFDLDVDTQFDEMAIEGGGPITVELKRLYNASSLAVDMRVAASMPVEDGVEMTGVVHVEMDLEVLPG